MTKLKINFKNDFFLLKNYIFILTLNLMLVSSFMACNKNETSTKTEKNNKVTTNPTSTPPSNNTNPEIPSGVVGDAKESLDRLLQGNERYTTGNLQIRDLSKTKLEELAKKQTPLAVVITCSDSQVSPELFFDQSQGDIFVIRTLGNVLDKITVGSIEYALQQLNPPLVMVVGHENCGIVSFATKEQAAKGNIQYVVNEIKPSIAKARKLGGDLVVKTTEENVKLIVETLPGRSEIISDLIRNNKLKIVGANYSLSTGKIDMLVNLEESPTAEEKK